MLRIDTMEDPRGVAMTLAAPLTTLDYRLAQEQIAAVPEKQWRRLLIEVDSIAIVEPGVIWEDLKMAPLVRHMHAVAVVSDVEWFTRMTEIAGAVWPGLTVSHFESFDRDAALRWLRSFAS